LLGQELELLSELGRISEVTAELTQSTKCNYPECPALCLDPIAPGWNVLLNEWYCPEHLLCRECNAIPTAAGEDICYDCLDREMGLLDEEDAEIEWDLRKRKGEKPS
jgi:hypothetical protein